MPRPRLSALAGSLLTGSLLVGAALLLGTAATPALAAEVDEQRLMELLDAADDVQRGESSHAVVQMHVKTEHYERTMKMESWAKGEEKSLIRILEPAKDAGVATLMVDDNIWNYLPKVDRTMKVPAGMMGGSWMGSHFTNDDLVKSSRLADDYSAEALATPEDGGNWRIALTPRPDAPVVWGRVELDITPEEIPVEARYYDEKGSLIRTMTWAEVEELGDRKVPTLMTLIPADSPEEFTRISYDELDFGIELEDRMFTLQSLKR